MSVETNGIAGTATLGSPGRSGRDARSFFSVASLFEIAGDAMLCADQDMRIMALNPASEKMFGFSSEEIVGESVFRLIPLGQGALFQEKLKRLAGEASLIPFDAVMMTKQGSRFPVSVCLSPVENFRGAGLGSYWVVRDIAGEREMVGSLRKLSAVVEQTADSVMITNPDGWIEYVNPAFCSTSGYAQSEAVGAKSNLLKSGKHSRLFYQEMWKTIKQGRPFSGTLINKKRDGTFFYTQKTITPLKDEEGRISHFVSTDKDITAQTMAEHHLRGVQRRFAELFNYSPDPMAYCALDGTILEVNPGFSAFTGYPAAELVNQMAYSDISGAKDPKHGQETIKHMLSSGEPLSQENEYRRKDGTVVPGMATVFPVKDEGGKNVIGIGMVIKDISELKRKQREIELADAELKRSNLELEQFASVASHDLQEPLRTMRIYLQLIERKFRSKLDADSAAQLEFVIHASHRLSSLVADLLTYSRVAKGKPVAEEVDVTVAAKEALRYLESSILESRARVEVEGLPVVLGDGSRIVQVLQNLIGNAIKYRSEEAPVIKVTAKRGTSAWVFCVEDNGAGLVAEVRERVFDMFYRTNVKETLPGTGIGLAICKKIVEQRGGSIWVESIVGRGSSFFFSIPDELPPTWKRKGKDV